MRALYRTLQSGIKIITTGTVVDDSLRYEGIRQPDTPEQPRCPRSRAGCCLYIVTLVIYLTSCCVYMPPFPQIDIIGAVVIVWRVREKTIRSVLYNIVCNNCAQCNAHTYEQT